MTTPPVVSITDELIAELEVAANAATPGPWRYEAGEEDTDGPAAWPEVYAGDVAIIGDEGFYGDNEQDESNAEFIARVDPSTILALLAERADLKLQLAAASVDAGRYRFLRNESVNADGDTVMAAKIDGAGDQISNWFFGAGLDAAIDAARDIAAMDIGSGD